MFIELSKSSLESNCRLYIPELNEFNTLFKHSFIIEQPYLKNNFIRSIKMSAFIASLGMFVAK